MTSTKKCPECHTYLLNDAKECDFCKTKLRKADKGGIAQKTINWMSYFHCLLSWIILVLFVWWSFFPEK
jgi:hypothetical protein